MLRIIRQIKNETSYISVLIFAVTVLAVCILQFLLLKVILPFGLSSEDWLLLFKYKIIGPRENLLDRLFATFNASGVYSTTYIFYIGILESLFKNNYLSYQITNIFLKTLATVSLYPLILTIFKRRLLAFLTTILFAISYSSSGVLQFVVKGSDYLAIFFMNMCLIAYYLSFKTRRRFIFHATTILLFLSFIFSPIRMYPLLLFIILVEIIIWVKSHQWVVLLFRLSFLFLPFLIIMQFGPGSTGSYLTAPGIVLKFISYGNYQLLLTPFAGLGYTFLPNDYLSIFGNVNFDNLKDYLFFLLRGPIIIYSFLAILLGFLLTNKPIPIACGIIFANLIFEIITYFFVTNARMIIGPNMKGFPEISTNAIFLGFFVISVAASSLIVWLRSHRSNILLLSLFAGPLFSSVFLWGTWLIIGDNLTFKEGIHWYLIIPPIGTSLFLASLMVMGSDRIKTVINPYLKYTLMTCLFLVLLPVYLISGKEINTSFNYLLHIGYGASDQEEIKSKLLSKMKAPLDTNPTLFYLDASSDLNEDPLYYPVTVISGFDEKMHFRNWEVVNGCVGLIYDKATLEKSVIVKNGIKGFNVASLCVYDYISAGRPEIFYTPDNFYALKFKDREAIDIKKDTLKQLGF